MVQCDGCGSLSPLEGVLGPTEKHTKGRTEWLVSNIFNTWNI